MGKSYESIYGGSYGVFDPPTYGSLFTGYRTPVSNISFSTDPRTANQITEVTNKLSGGMKNLEVEGLSPEVFESIPKEHLKEINRMGKLTGAEFSLHGPMLDPAGFEREGWSEADRLGVEQQMKFAIEKAHDLNSSGNVPVTFHASTGGRGGAGLASTEIRPIFKNMPRGEEKIVVVDRESGGLGVLRREKRFVRGKEEWYETDKQLNKDNKRVWDGHMSNVAWENMVAKERIKGSLPIIAPILESLEKKEMSEEDLLPQQRDALNTFKMGKIMTNNMLSSLEHDFNRADRLWSPEIKKERQEEIRKIQNGLAYIDENNLVEKNPIDASEKLSTIIGQFHKLVQESPPNQYQSTDSFALEKSKDTISNVALHAFKKFGDKAPAMCMENIFPGTVFSTGGELAKLVKASREEFVKKAHNEMGMDEQSARAAAEKLIGATFDTGHMFMLRKYGYTPEQTVEEARKVAPFVKHVHISDNFGFEHTELPPGMGQVPIKEMLKEMEKQGFKGKEVVEFGTWAQHFKTVPIAEAFEGLGSPIYGMQMQPFWNQARGSYGIPAPYSGGYGMMLPEQHFSIYGSGFSTLPSELGGQMPGKGQRFSGAPME